MPKSKNRSLFRRWKLSGAPKRFKRTRLSGWEQLEERVLLATFSVVNIHDSGAGSLRQAILDANSTTEPDTIVFNIGTGVQTITPTSPLPTIASPVIIDGTTQPGFSDTPIIEVSGASAGDGAIGLRVSAGSSTIKGLVVNRFSSSGIQLDTKGGNVIQGNFVGTNPAGTTAFGNGGNGGILIVNSPNNLVGGSSTGQGNLLSGNLSNGLRLTGPSSTDNIVEGNLIGTNAAGSAAIPNINVGLSNENAPRTRIGGMTPGAGNVISGNKNIGIRLNGASTTGVIVQGNYIGVDITGMVGLGNTNFGVDIDERANNNLIGGTTAAARNIISANTNDGVRIRNNSSTGVVTGNQIQGNYIGTNVLGTASLPNKANGVRIDNATSGATGNTIGGASAGAGNVISGNASYGIDLNGGGSGFTIIQGNLIGTDATGTIALGNGLRGVMMNNSSDNLLGGTTSEARNVISGTVRWEGVGIWNSSTRNRVEGNFIGTNITGTIPLANGEAGVYITAAGNVVGGPDPGSGNLISGNRLMGVRLVGTIAQDNVVAGNFIGTDVTGTTSITSSGHGVLVDGGASNNVIGGASTAARNVIAGNTSGHGVFIINAGAAGNSVMGNYIGTDVTGTLDLANRDGIAIVNAPNVVVGGASPGAGNLISGNDQNGIEVVGALSNGIQIAGNYVGTDFSGTLDLGNAFSGIHLRDGASNNVIGGTTAGAGNLVSGNDFSGVVIDAGNSVGNLVAGNRIGTDVTGTIPVGNNWNGVQLSGAPDNVIGGTTSAARNVISGNTLRGVLISGATAINNVIQGNFIGADASGANALGNGGVGIFIDANVGPNLIGGTAPGSGNVISASVNGVGIGIQDAAGGIVIQGNRIGTDVSGTRNLGNRFEGIKINRSPGNLIGGPQIGAGNLISGNDLYGVRIVNSGSFSNVVQGNLIGTDISGTLPLGNTHQGVRIENASNNRIGGLVSGAGNVISANNSIGLALIGVGAVDNAIEGNFIGTTAAGDAKLGNKGQGGIFIQDAPRNRIGGTDPLARNVISGNSTHGVTIQGAGAVGNVLLGNLIGTDATGTSPVANGLDGILITQNASGNIVGGTSPGEGNLIALNNRVGVNILGTTVGNAIRGNSIHSNGQLGIDLNFNGITPNDLGDADGGPNNLQNFPLLTGALIGTGGTSVTGTLNSTAGQTFFIDLYANPEGTGDPSGYGEGQRYLGSTTLTTDAGGNGNFTYLAMGVASRDAITATATDAAGNTSEFAFNVLANTPPLANAGGPYTVPEGGGVLLDASGSFDPDQDPDTLVYEWDFDHDGLSFTVDASGSESFFDASLLDGETTRTVAVRVTDAGGLSDVGTAIVTIQNVAPTVGISGSARALAGGTLTLTLSATDPSLADQNAGFTFHIDWDGDGTIDMTVQPADSLVVDHTFGQTGFFTVHVTATDKDGATSPAVMHDVLIVQPVEVDVRDSVNLQSSGVIAVTIFSSSTFDVSRVDANSVVFAGAFAVQHAFEDVNRDGTLDLVLHFRTQDTNLRQVYEQLLAEDIQEDGQLDSNKQEAKVILTGETVDAVFFEGADDLSLFLSGKSLRDLLEDLAWRGLI